ncbi:AI-2E family transporter [Halioxenophilus sp. WMMB6]|uniref:AI-2E family transporter n=1 Tax=Halioxenophilus sp. WMMB6 TaxID=3073815 RepID=UPI00295EA8AC|nr:AI-2E family transporter [Halioxenophilus sp. WMMB6]
MLRILSNWIHRYLSDEEAVLLVIFLIVALVVTFTMGTILAPMLAGMVIAFLLQGLVLRLRGFGLPHVVAVTITFLIFVGFIGVSLFWIMPVIWEQMRGLFAELPRMLTKAQQLLLLLPEKYPSLISQVQVQEVLDMTRKELGNVGQSLLTLSLANVPILMGVLIYLVLVPLLVFFFLKDSVQIQAWLSSFLPHHRPVMTRIWLEMNQQIANYVRGKVMEIFIVGIVSYICFSLLGVNYALLLGVMVGLSVIVPYIGAAAVTVPVALVGYFQWGWSGEFFYLVAAYTVIQALDGNVLVPLLFSEAVNLHPLAIILAVLVFGGLWGFWGVFFAIPLATLIKATVNAWPLAQAELAESMAAGALAPPAELNPETVEQEEAKPE